MERPSILGEGQSLINKKTETDKDMRDRSVPGPRDRARNRESFEVDYLTKCPPKRES